MAVDDLVNRLDEGEDIRIGERDDQPEHRERYSAIGARDP